MQKKYILIAIAAVAIIAVAEIGYRLWPHEVTNVDIEAAATPPALDKPNVTVEGLPPKEVSEDVLEQAIKEELSNSSEAAEAAQYANISFAGDATQALSIGSADATVEIIEYSSLSCPHCAYFHKTTLPELVKNYVETGKVRVVFQDFPLNKKAFDATMVSRCMPGDKRYGFMNLLFATMNDWLAAEDHIQALSQYAVIEGMDNEKLAECMNRPDVAESVIEGARMASETHKINSTPSFLLNGTTVLSGSIPYSEMAKQIDALLAE